MAGLCTNPLPIELRRRTGWFAHVLRMESRGIRRAGPAWRFGAAAGDLANSLLQRHEPAGFRHGVGDGHRIDGNRLSGDVVVAQILPRSTRSMSSVLVTG